MSDLMREALPIIFMYACVLALGPFIAVALWMAFDGDRDRSGELVATEQPAADPVKNSLEAREALGAA